MTPERIAELRESALSQGWHHSSRLLEALNEIERLGQLVRNAHILVISPPLEVTHTMWYCECRCNAHEWIEIGIYDTEVLAKAAHRAHVDALIAGTA
jgi:hypothetical protein